MHPSFFKLYAQGIYGEMDMLDIEGKGRYFTNMTKTCLVNTTLAVAFIDRFLSISQAERAGKGQEILQYTIVRAHEAAPLHAQIMGLYNMVTPSPLGEKKLTAKNDAG